MLSLIKSKLFLFTFLSAHDYTKFRQLEPQGRFIEVHARSEFLKLQSGGKVSHGATAEERRERRMENQRK